MVISPFCPKTMLLTGCWWAGQLSHQSLSMHPWPVQLLLHERVLLLSLMDSKIVKGGLAMWKLVVPVGSMVSRNGKGLHQ